MMVPHLRHREAFTLVEVMVSVTIIALVVTLLCSATDSTAKIWQRTASKIEQFSEARAGFERMTRLLSEATLNTYWDYRYEPIGNKGQEVAVQYVRQSELRFRSGLMSRLVPDGALRPTHGVFFQAPAGVVDDRGAHAALDKSLNTFGYFVEIGDDTAFIPPPIRHRVRPRHRPRLMELCQPTERLGIYDPAAAANPLAWLTEPIQQGEARPVRMLAENIVALVILPRLSRGDEVARAGKPILTPRFDYDSTKTSNDGNEPSKPDPAVNPKNQLPPVVQVVMVAVDEISASRLADRYAGHPGFGLDFTQLFQDATKLEDDPGRGTGAGDLYQLEQQLVAHHATYRVFATNVAVRGAKWSKSQTK